MLVVTAIGGSAQSAVVVPRCFGFRPNTSVASAFECHVLMPYTGALKEIWKK